jgi:hypothetical protein
VRVAAGPKMGRWQPNSTRYSLWAPDA